MRHLFSILKSTLGYQFEDIAPQWSPQGFCTVQLPDSQKYLDQKGPAKDTAATHIPRNHVNERSNIFDNEPSYTFSTLESATPKSPQQTTFAETPSHGIKLVDLPADVLFLLSDHLDTPSTHALSLTCRGFYGVGFPKTQRKIDPVDKKELLITLERDPLGNGRYYCQRCNKLHTYKTIYGPHSAQESADKSKGYVCGMRDRFTPMGNPYDLGHHHARLVMNRHFYGPDHGVPLKNICIQHESKRENTTIHCSTAANIINDELFLRRTYTFTISNADVPSFRRCTGHRDFRLCEHLPFFRNSSIYQQAIPELQRRPRNPSNKDEFVPCTNSPGSCGLCLLDYDISISRLDPGGNNWRVKIDAHHQIGECRSPDDWKWARFTEKSRPHLFLPNRPNRRGSGYNPGAVKRAWLKGSVQTMVDANLASLKRHSI